MFYSFIDFLKDIGAIILTAIVVIVILVLVLLTIFKKDDNSKKDINLSLSKETKHDKQNVKTYAIYRKSLQDYLIYLFDENAQPILKSDFTSSIISAKSLYERIKSNLTFDNFQKAKNQEGYYYAILKVSNTNLARTDYYISLSELDNAISKIISVNESAKLLEETYKVETMIDYADEIEVPKKKNILKSLFNNFKTIEIDNYFYVALYSKEKELILLSEPYLSKKDAKIGYDSIHESILKKSFKIDEGFNDKFTFYLLDSSNKILYQSFEYNKVEEAKERNKNIILNA